MRTLSLRAAGVLVASLSLLLSVAGCGLLSSSEDDPVAGVYETDDFRVRTAAAEDVRIVDLARRGVRLQLTLQPEGTFEGVFGGPFRVSDLPCGTGGEVPVAGTYEQDGRRVTFDFANDVLADVDCGTGTPLADVAWRFYEVDDADRLRANTEGYVLSLERIEELRAE